MQHSFCVKTVWSKKPNVLFPSRFFLAISSGYIDFQMKVDLWHDFSNHSSLHVTSNGSSQNVQLWNNLSHLEIFEKVPRCQFIIIRHLQFSFWVSPRRGIEPTLSLQRKLVTRVLREKWRERLSSSNSEAWQIFRVTSLPNCPISDITSFFDKYQEKK